MSGVPVWQVCRACQVSGVLGASGVRVSSGRRAACRVCHVCQASDVGRARVSVPGAGCRASGVPMC